MRLIAILGEFRAFLEKTLFGGAARTGRRAGDAGATGGFRAEGRAISPPSCGWRKRCGSKRSAARALPLIELRRLSSAQRRFVSRRALRSARRRGAAAADRGDRRGRGFFLSARQRSPIRRGP